MMKKYIFLFNSSFEIIVSAKNSGSDFNIELFKTLLNLIEENIHFTRNKSLFKIEYFFLETIHKQIQVELNSLLIQRINSVPSSEQTEWRSRFTEEQMFQSKRIFGNEYKLFAGGIDYKIFWHACFFELIENCLKNKSNIYVLFNDKVVDITQLQRVLFRLEKKT
jgi:hypothetical protein